MLTVRPLTFGTSRALTPAGSVLLPYGGSFSKDAIVVICDRAGDEIAMAPSAEAPVRNSRLEGPDVVVPAMSPPAPRPLKVVHSLARDFPRRDPPWPQRKDNRQAPRRADITGPLRRRVVRAPRRNVFATRRTG